MSSESGAACCGTQRSGLRTISDEAGRAAGVDEDVRRGKGARKRSGGGNAAKQHNFRRDDGSHSQRCSAEKCAIGTTKQNEAQ